MNSLSILFPSVCHQPPHYNQFKLHSNYLHKFYHGFYDQSSLAWLSIKLHPLHSRHSLVCAIDQPQEGVVAVMNFEEQFEKDWSFLDSDGTNSREDQDKINRIVCAGNVMETSKVLVSLGSDDFVDCLIQSSPCQLLLVVHDSLLSLACIKERHDKVKCWQGELIYVPEKWSPFDTVFLYFLPAMPFKIEEIFKALATRCSPGARVVISNLRGRPGLDQQRQQHPDVIVSDLPDRSHLEKVSSVHSFVMKDYSDDSSSYLAVLEFKP